MGKKDKDFGEWVATTLISGKLSIKQFENGFILKKRGELITERIKFTRKTTPQDMADIITNYYKNLQKNIEMGEGGTKFMDKKDHKKLHKFNSKDIKN